MKTRKLKHIPTAKIMEILDHPYCQGIDGADYEPVKHELESILWERLNRVEDKSNNELIKQYNEAA